MMKTRQVTVCQCDLCGKEEPGDYHNSGFPDGWRVRKTDRPYDEWWCWCPQCTPGVLLLNDILPNLREVESFRRAIISWIETCYPTDLNAVLKRDRMTDGEISDYLDGRIEGMQRYADQQSQDGSGSPSDAGDWIQWRGELREVAAYVNQFKSKVEPESE